jgi:hypothetical protein
MSTLLREFEFELADEQARARAQEGHFHGKIPAMMSVGISDLADPLMVKAKHRTSS